MPSKQRKTDCSRINTVASKKPPKSRQTNVKPTVANLASVAYDKGLLPDALDELIDVVTTPNYLDQASLATIVRNLYPATRVSRDVVLRVLSCFGHGKLKASLNIQAALLRWLVLVYHALETPAVLSQAYTVLFNLLDTVAIRLVSRCLQCAKRRAHALLGLSYAICWLSSLGGSMSDLSEYRCCQFVLHFSVA